MEQADWDAVALYFSEEGGTQASAKRRAFLRKQGEDVDSGDSEIEAYRQAFLSAYGIIIDWKEGLFTLFESLDEQLDDALFSAMIDYDSEPETATVTLAGQSHVFQYAALGDEDFGEALARLEPLLLQVGFSLRVYTESFYSDTLTLLLLPDTLWQRADNLFGPAAVQQHFIRYSVACTPDPAAPRARMPWWVFIPAVALIGWILYSVFFS